MTELEQLKQQALELTQRIEALENAGKAKGGVWLPKVGKEYFYKGAIDISSTTFNSDASDSSIIGKTRVYPTRQLAEADDCRKETIAVWNKFREMETEAVDWANNAQRKFLPIYEHDVKKFKKLTWSACQYNPEN